MWIVVGMQDRQHRDHVRTRRRCEVRHVRSNFNARDLLRPLLLLVDLSEQLGNQGVGCLSLEAGCEAKELEKKCRCLSKPNKGKCDSINVLHSHNKAMPKADDP